MARRLALVLIACHLSLGLAVAQVSVEASIDSIEILVGQQAHVTLKAVAPEAAKVEFPQFKPSEYVTPGVEVLQAKPAEDQQSDNGMVERSTVYTITSFDDTLYYLPPLTVRVDGKPYKSKSLALKVLSFEVDTAHVDKFFGPKDVQDLPFLWSEWSLVFWLTLLILIIWGLTYYLYVRLRDNKPIVSHLRLVKKLLPHQRAMQEIEQIKAERLVSSENQKEYYTKLTDTLRRYIEERYGFNAMEMTSSEIIARLTENQSQEQVDELHQLFMTADLVKFAKYSTLINENDRNLVSAIDFINKTKLEATATDEPERPKLTEEEVRTQQTRRTLKGLIIGLLVVSVLLLAYVGYNCYLLLA